MTILHADAANRNRYFGRPPGRRHSGSGADGPVRLDRSAAVTGSSSSRARGTAFWPTLSGRTSCARAPSAFYGRYW